jgi:repressor LexA
MNNKMTEEIAGAAKRGRKPTLEITESQLRTLRAIEKHIDEHDMPPTGAELSETLGLTRSTIHDQIEQLIRKGYLSRESGKARKLTVLREAKQEPNMVTSIPIVGTVAAGRPILAEENIVGELLMEPAALRGGQHFALNVQGDSMVNAGISEGDLLIVRRQVLAETGDVVVALLDDGATVKRLWMRNGQVELRPENPAYQPIPIEPDNDSFRLLGKVVAVRRRTPKE